MYWRLLCALPQQSDVPGSPPAPLSEVAPVVLDELDETGRRIADAVLASLDCRDAPVAPDTSPDAVWLAWLDRLDALAEDTGSAWLRSFADFERALRFGLADHRAQRNPALTPPPRAAVDPQVTLPDLTGDPVEVERRIDAMRLAAIRQLADGAPFSRDEVLSYLAAAVVLDQWDDTQPQLMEVWPWAAPEP